MVADEQDLNSAELDSIGYSDLDEKEFNVKEKDEMKQIQIQLETADDSILPVHLLRKEITKFQEDY